MLCLYVGVKKEGFHFVCSNVLLLFIHTDLMNAATKIQASFRGHMARKQAEKSKTDTEINKEMEEKAKVSDIF